ncbi:MAG: iron-sulfur cluster assembly scaffold protein [archaeon]
MDTKNTTYTDEVKKHFLNPHNMGEIKNADGVGKLGNPQCGDVFWLYISVTKNKKGEEIIKDIKFQTMGCAAAISTSSMITDLAKGKTLEKAMKITNKDVAESLKGLPLIKMHCSNMAADTLHEAIKDYLSKKNSKGKKIKIIKKEACYRCCNK